MNSDNPVLSLARWGIERNLAPLPLGNTPTSEQIAAQVEVLAQMSPEDASAWIQGPEPGETCFPPWALRAAKDSEDAASLVLSAIADQMLEHHE